MSTMHGVKGLEFDCVFVINCDDGVVPLQSGNVNEESRLMYVAMTRSKGNYVCL